MNIIDLLYFYSECGGGYINELIRGTMKENAINLSLLFYLIIGFYSSFSRISGYLSIPIIHINDI